MNIFQISCKSLGLGKTMYFYSENLSKFGSAYLTNSDQTNSLLSKFFSMARYLSYAGAESGPLKKSSAPDANIIF